MKIFVLKPTTFNIRCLNLKHQKAVKNEFAYNF